MKLELMALHVDFCNVEYKACSKAFWQTGESCRITEGFDDLFSTYAGFLRKRMESLYKLLHVVDVLPPTVALNWSKGFDTECGIAIGVIIAQRVAGKCSDIASNRMWPEVNGIRAIAAFHLLKRSTYGTHHRTLHILLEYKSLYAGRSGAERFSSQVIDFGIYLICPLRE